MSRLITYWVELKTQQDWRALNESTIIYVNLGDLTEGQQKTCSKCWPGSLENGGIRRVMTMCRIDALVSEKLILEVKFEYVFQRLLDRYGKLFN